MSTKSDISDPLLSVLRRIEKGHIRVDLNPAFRFLQTVHDKIRIGHRHYLVDIEKCLKRVHGGESPSDEEMTRAIDVYNKYVNKFILEELKTVRNARDQKHHVFKDGGNMKTQHALSDNSDQVPGRISGDRKSSDLLSDLGTVLQDQSHVTNASNTEAKDVQTTFGHDNMLLQESTANDVSTMPQPVFRKIYELIGALEKYELHKPSTQPPRQLVLEADEDYSTIIRTIPQRDRLDKYALAMILNCAKNKQFLRARTHCQQAKEEINELSKMMIERSKQTQHAIPETDQMPDFYHETSLSAKNHGLGSQNQSQVAKLRTFFGPRQQQESHVSSSPNRTDHQNAQQQQRYGTGTQSLTNPVPARHDKNSMATTANPGDVGKQTTRNHDNQQQKTKRKNGQSLDMIIRHNNPDIVDLSDENGSTEIAERYSELYDNQCTDAFEELTVQGNKTEEQAIEILRNITEESVQLKTVKNARDQKHHVLKDGGNMKTQHALSDNSEQVPGRISGDRKSSDLLSDLGTVLHGQSHATIASNVEAKDVQTTISHDNMIRQKSTANFVKPQTVKLSRRHNEPEPLEKQHIELARRFWELFLNEWKDAYDEIVKAFGTETTIRHLLWIITEVRLICLNIAERQLKEMEKSAIGIMENPMPKPHPTYSKYPVRHVTDTLPTSLELLLTFRRRNADLSIPYVKQECREEICRALIESFDFSRDTLAKAFRLVAYINKGAELVWLMSVQDPPIVLEVIDRDAEGTRFNNEHYNPFTQSGTVYQYGVWPVLRYGKGGPIISRGIAQGGYLKCPGKPWYMKY